jgi:hypothetical protein
VAVTAGVGTAVLVGDLAVSQSPSSPDDVVNSLALRQGSRQQVWGSCFASVVRRHALR